MCILSQKQKGINVKIYLNIPEIKDWKDRVSQIGSVFYDLPNDAFDIL